MGLSKLRTQIKITELTGGGDSHTTLCASKFKKIFKICIYLNYNERKVNQNIASLSFGCGKKSVSINNLLGEVYQRLFDELHLRKELLFNICPEKKKIENLGSKKGGTEVERLR